MELEIFKKTIQYGDDIRLIPGNDFNKLNIDLQDFWLIDNATAVDLHYDLEGGWIGFGVDNDVSKYIKAKEIILAHSVPLAEFQLP